MDSEQKQMLMIVGSLLAIIFLIYIVKGFGKENFTDKENAIIDKAKKDKEDAVKEAIAKAKKDKEDAVKAAIDKAKKDKEDAVKEALIKAKRDADALAARQKVAAAAAKKEKELNAKIDALTKAVSGAAPSSQRAFTPQQGAPITTANVAPPPVYIRPPPAYIPPPPAYIPPPPPPEPETAIDESSSQPEGYSMY